MKIHHGWTICFFIFENVIWLICNRELQRKEKVQKLTLKEPDIPDNFKKYKTKIMSKNIILSKSKYDLKARH